MKKENRKSAKITMLLLGTIASLGHAKMTICKVENIHAGVNISGIKGLAWDDQSKKARVTDFSGKEHQGEVTLVSGNSEKEERVNIFVEYPKEYLGYNASEYVVYLTGQDQYRVIGVSYIFRNGNYHLRSLSGSDEADCFSTDRQ